MLRDPDEETGLAPQPGIGDLDALAASVRAAGLPVNLVIDGDHAALPAAVDVSVYRIVQEALTNVLKHAGPARAEVTIGCADGHRHDRGHRRRNRASPVTGPRPAGTGWPGCASGPRYSAVTWPPGRGPAAGSPCAPGCRSAAACRRRAVVISVLIADDQDLVREGLRMLLEAEPDLTVAGEAADGSQALAQARLLDPDVILMDVRMPRMNGIEATTRLVQAGSRARILMLTTFNLDEYVYHALKAGASGFLLKDASREQLTGAVRAVAAGETLLAPAITRRLIEDFCSGPAPGTPAAGAAGRPQRTGTRRRAARGPGPVERRDRRQALPQRGHRQEPHRPHPRQARPARPGAGRRLRLRARHRPARPRQLNLFEQGF